MTVITAVCSLLYLQDRQRFSLFVFFVFFFFVLCTNCCLHLCQDEDEFPNIASGEAVKRTIKAESATAQTHTQPKMPKNLV